MDDVFEGDGAPLEPDFHPSLSYWGAYLMFHRPSRLSDEEMQWHFGEHDGRWSRQTKAAVAKSGAKGLDLNQNWALARQIWSCPGCGRGKEECFRLSRRGILLAKLELHHDHMRDLVWPRASELLGDDWRDRIQGTGEMLGLIRDLVSRFSEALVCSECNAADGKAKKLIPEIDRRFTFTVSEIRQFAIPRAGEDHGVDIARARAVWEGQRDGFEMRLGLLDSLIREIGTGRLVRDREGWPGIVPMEEKLGGQRTVWKSFCKEVGQDDRRSEISGLRDEFLTRSVSLDSRRLAQPAATTIPWRIPTDEEYAAYSDPVSQTTWAAAGEDWTCACCARRKRDIVRMSKKGRWSGGIRSLRMLVDETDSQSIMRRARLFPGYRNEFWVKDSYFIEVCSDCSNVGREARQRDRSASNGHLKLEDIRDALMEVRPHSAHAVNYDLIRERMQANQPYDSAYEAYSAFRLLVSRMRATLDFRAKHGVPREVVIPEFYETLQFDYGVETPEEQADLVEWLLVQKSGDSDEPSR